jgi:hypothetical protein
MGKAIQIDTKVTGPFFNHGATAIEIASREWVEDMIREGEAKLDAQLYPGHGVATGEYKRTIHSAIRSSMHGTIDDSPDKHMSIIGAWLEGGRSRNEKHRFKGYGIWRKTRTHLRKLAKELAGHVYKRAVKRLT